ncbi:cytochrome P450 [Guyanagaster necrorhizus]|uniref:Cytochrome P450 n=1 Tax=Guyanagaster necrorhizus TaxID=856835 RepID=A0A9P7VWC8_9AGAR|nr:cytochrome P450 [Guyanagaster necrorhizus MCA 3950]KAG7447374.1 cytochrome P450 [Guyanagaster necrorhizus MCA 3950]
MDPLHLVDLLACLVLGYVLYKLCTARKLRLPPGPRGLPIIGNIYNVPKRDEWIAYRDMAQQYNSDIIHLNLMGTSLIVINSREAARELFDKRSAIYSDRRVEPPYHMLNGLMGFTWHFAFHRYGASWKEHRKLFHKEFVGSVVTSHYPRLLDGSRVLLQKLLNDPKNFRETLRFVAARIILGVAYGIDVRDYSDYYVQTAENAMTGMAAAGNAGSFLVDSFPILRHIPDWFPGAGFKKKAANWSLSVKAMPRVPMKFVHDSIAAGTASYSIASKHLAEIGEHHEHLSEKVELLGNVLAASYAGKTVSTLSTFILAMTQNPEIQAKAHEAIDNAIGRDRLPEFEDYKSIPYINAIHNEVLRWRAVTPLAVPHSVSQDDEYRGYHIPKDSIVVGNTWAMLNDVSVYGEDPDSFNPDRWLKDGVMNPDIPHPEEAFGFGRRICPGQEMAEASMWMSIASILAVFDITKAVDDKGNAIEPSGEFTSGLLSHPVPFQCEIKPRSKYAISLIQSGIHVL